MFRRAQVALEDGRKINVVVVNGPENLEAFLKGLQEQQDKNKKHLHRQFHSDAHAEYVLFINNQQYSFLKVSYPEKRVDHYDIRSGRGMTSDMTGRVQGTIPGATINDVSYQELKANVMHTDRSFGADQSLPRINFEDPNALNAVLTVGVPFAVSRVEQAAAHSPALRAGQTGPK